MKVLMINGSSRKHGCTYLALKEIGETLAKEGIEYEIFELGGSPIRDCIGCNSCAKTGCCVFSDDPVNGIIEKAKEADGFIFGSPVYYAHPSGQLLSLMDRLFYAGGYAFRGKAAASIVTARRAGTTASLDVINKHILNNDMFMAGSSYWNMVFGPSPDKVKEDEEGLQTMRNLAHNMAYLLKCLESGKEKGITLPEGERGAWTNFNR